jgi:cell division septation protein DedD
LKRTGNVVNKDEWGSNLCWRPEGRCTSFTRESILASAPPSSGVYGLVNFDRQMFIGESDNIREVLLRHENETDFKSHGLKPTGFAFELCGAESRKLWAGELIARFQPVLQKEAVLTELWSPSNGSTLDEPDQGGWKLGTDADHQEFPVREREDRPKHHWTFQLNRTYTVTLVSILVASAAVIFYYRGLPADYAIHKRANGANPASDQTRVGQRLAKVSSNQTAGRPANQNAGTDPVTSSTSIRNNTVQASEKSSAANELGVQAKTGSVADSAVSSNLRKKWSVQISAAPVKDKANVLVQQLKAKGYDGYLVLAEVKGQTYYRVRVGRFDKREEAESMRQSLARQDGYREAYLTSD